MFKGPSIRSVTQSSQAARNDQVSLYCQFGIQFIEIDTNIVLTLYLAGEDVNKTTTISA